MFNGLFSNYKSGLLWLFNCLSVNILALTSAAVNYYGALFVLFFFFIQGFTFSLCISLLSLAYQCLFFARRVGLYSTEEQNHDFPQWLASQKHLDSVGFCFWFIEKNQMGFRMMLKQTCYSGRGRLSYDEMWKEIWENRCSLKQNVWVCFPSFFLGAR